MMNTDIKKTKTTALSSAFKIIGRSTVKAFNYKTSGEDAECSVMTSSMADLSGLGEPSGLFSKLVIGVTAWMADWFSRMATA